jgi:hypothetical protein
MTKRLDHSFYRTFNGIRGERSEIRRYDLPQLTDLERFVIRENCHNAKLNRLNYFRVGIDLSYLRMALWAFPAMRATYTSVHFLVGPIYRIL